MSCSLRSVLVSVRPPLSVAVSDPLADSFPMPPALPPPTLPSPPQQPPPWCSRSETGVSKVWPHPDIAAIGYTARNAFFISTRYYRSPFRCLNRSGKVENGLRERVAWQNSEGIAAAIVRIRASDFHYSPTRIQNLCALGFDLFGRDDVRARFDGPVNCSSSRNWNSVRVFVPWIHTPWNGKKS